MMTMMVMVMMMMVVVVVMIVVVVVMVMVVMVDVSGVEISNFATQTTAIKLRLLATPYLTCRLLVSF